MEFYAQIYSSNGTTVQGSGPISTVISWQQTIRVNRAGEFEFRMLANDPQAGNVSPLNLVKCIGIVRGGYNTTAGTLYSDKYMYMGGGIIQNVVTEINDDGKTILVVSGQDFLGELAWVSLDRKYFDGNLTPPATATTLDVASNVALLSMATPQNGWVALYGTTIGSGTGAYNALYGRWSYDNVLQAMIKLAEYSGAYFVLSPDLSTAITGTGFRRIRWEQSFVSTNIRAVQVEGNSSVAPDTVIIKNITRINNRVDFATRVIPFGAGNGDSRITMLPSNIPVDPLFSYVTVAGQYKGIRDSTSESTYGVHTHVVQWPEVVPEDNTSTAVEKAADQLYYLALNYLLKKQQSMTHYEVELAESLVTVLDFEEMLLRPLHRIRVQYRDPEQGIYLDEVLNIIEMTHSIDANGLQTTRLLVGNVESYPTGDTEAVVERLAENEIYKTASQVLPNTHTLTFSKPIGRAQTPVTALRFRLGSDVVQVYSVIFDFILTGMISTVSAVSSDSADTTLTTSTMTSHNHTIATHNHPSHTHTENNVLGGQTGATTINNNTTPLTTGDSGSHFHTIADHKHTITSTITYDAVVSSTPYIYSDLEYRLNGGAWVNMADAVATTGSWYRFNLTANIRNATTLRPNQADNLIEIRRKSATLNNIAQIDAQITVQSTVQTIV